nr:insulinase family protein [Bacteroidales bacterium]
MKQERVLQFSNGIRAILHPAAGEVCCCGFAIKAGTRDELPHEQGIAHFTEHMLFKGTTHRKAWQILDRMGAVGGEINAYTTKEEIFLYAICLKKDYGRALELMCDMLFHSTFPQHEIESEREVVLDEINVYEDSPAELIYDDFEKLLYPGQTFGYNILGDVDCLRAMKTADFQHFMQRCFTTDRIVFFSMSSMPEKQQLRLLDKYLKEIPDTSAASVLSEREQVKMQVAVRESINRQTHQAHVLYGNAAYHLYSEQRLPLFFLNNILGGPGMNSLLNNALREKRGLVYTVESVVNAYSDSGLFSIYFGCDHKDVQRCLSIVDKELKRLREMPLTEARLRAAKKQLQGQLAIASENKESQALSMGKSLLYFDYFESVEKVLNQIEALSAKQLQEVAKEVFHPDTMSLLVYGES